MPSPFPGMDPYVERPQRWQELHGNLAPEIQGQLNQIIVPRYRAQLTPTLIYDVIEVAQTRSIGPDVGVLRTVPARGEPPTAVATLAPPPPTPSRVPLEVPLRLYHVEIRATADGQLVTVIEILSPANKRRGHEAHDEYRRKRRDLLRSSVHLMEIDLLRRGERPPLEDPRPPAPYYVMLSRAERRPHVDLWPIRLADPLPVLPIPLLEPDPDVYLDLGAAVNAAYARCAFEAAIDYRKAPPPPPLSAEEATWVEALLREKGLRGDHR